MATSVPAWYNELTAVVLDRRFAYLLSEETTVGDSFEYNPAGRAQVMNTLANIAFFDHSTVPTDEGTKALAKTALDKVLELTAAEAQTMIDNMPNVRRNQQRQEEAAMAWHARNLDNIKKGVEEF